MAARGRDGDPVSAMTAYDHFTESLRRWARHDVAGALESATLAHAAAPHETLYDDAARFLTRTVEQGCGPLQSDVGAFAAFIGGGSNLPLYDNCRALLAERIAALHPPTLLDIGSGEGTIIVPVVRELDPRPRVTLCDPAVALLERAVDLAHWAGLDVEALPYPVEVLLRARPEQRWEVATATWSLHAIAPAARGAVLATLAQRVGTLFLAEFDDLSDSFADPLDPLRVQHIHDRYLVGLAEYPGEEGARVRRGFLLPVLYGYFNAERRSTYEQPIAAWEEELRAAGWEPVERRRIAPYWWADAYLIEARSRA